MKRFFALFMAVLLCMVMPITAFATENVATTNNQELKLAEGEVIVYQDDSVTVTSLPASAVDESVLNARATTYESVWLDKSASGNFKINTSNSGTIGITLKVESSSDDSFAYITMRNPAGKTFTGDGYYVKPSTNGGDGEYFKYYGASAGTYTVDYVASTQVGMRIMCWIY